MNDAVACEPYRNLADRMREASLLEHAMALLDWDQETCLPKNAVEYRADQLSYLSGRIHRIRTAPEIGGWLADCEARGFDAESVEGVNIREWRHDHDQDVKLPNDFVERFEKETALAKAAWADARAASDFGRFKNQLRAVVDLSRRKADFYGYEESPYDALLDVYERGMRASAVRAVFERLRPFIIGLVPAAVERCRSVPADLLKGDYPIDRQAAFNRDVAAAIGFDFDSGRVDAAVHPFCTSLGPHDHRLTTRYDPADFTVSLYSVLHEAGHGLYEQGLKPEHFGTPMGRAVSLGIHESQSRLWENKVGRTLAFWRHWHPIACKHLPDLRRFSPEQIHAGVNRVSPSFIRVEADEFLYDLHIILRFEIEEQLLAGAISVDDVPGVWNAGFEQMLGLGVPDDAHGCLQDIHWSMGGIGYFPTYTLGNLNSAQLFAAAARELPGLESDLAEGRYDSLLGWLRDRVHRFGARFQPDALMQQATGETTHERFHTDYLESKLADLGLSSPHGTD